MIIDTSALVAVVLEEPRQREFVSKMTGAGWLRISAVTLTEASIVLFARGGQVKVDIMMALLARLGVETVPCDEVLVPLALDAFRRYGKGQHRAGLNLGDCFTYALAKYYGEPLLFQGNDFSETDLVSA
jgi:ribonuclease VapC